MSLQPGDRLGPYEIIAPLGAGGMGEVYSARDTRLGRTVAIKLTQERFTDRFEREARTISALNHPNICQLYDVGPNFLVMELVDGVPVAAVDSPRKLLDLAVQMAEGLAAAHAAGIVHRDLKPDNILVTRDGRVKILDFGLAVARRALAGANEASTVAGTEPGIILGTVNYMSPEQARGQTNVTAQSDQFSLGLVLYELAAGRRAFRRESATETMTAIIREEPDPLPATTPTPLRWVIERLLSKDPADRYDSTRDLHRELRQIRDRLSQATTAAVSVPTDGPPRAQRRVLSAATLGPLMAGVLLGGAGVWFAASRPSAPREDLSTFTFAPIATDAAQEGTPSWSPDGKSIAYVVWVNEAFQVFTRSIGSTEATQITRGATSATLPFWSPDGASVYFNTAGGLWVVGSAGGTPDRLFDGTGWAVAHPDGKTLLFLRARAFWVGRRGEEPREFTLPEEIAKLPGARTLCGFSPDGSKLAFLAGDALWTMPYPTGTPQRVIADPTLGFASWMPDSRRMVLRRSSGPEHSTFSMIDTGTGDDRVFYALPSIVHGAAVSPDGTALAYDAGRPQLDVVEVTIADGRVRTLQSTGNPSIHPAWAPSGTRYLFATYRSQRSGIEEASVAERFARRLIDVGDGLLTFPRWAPDGRQFLFTWNHDPPRPGQLMISTVSGQMSPLDPQAPGRTAEGIWSADGQHVIYPRTVDGQRTEVARIRPGSTAAPEILATYPFGQAARVRRPMAASPTGEWILARSDEQQPIYFLMSPDFKSERPLASRRLGIAAGFSKDGRDVIGLVQDTSAERAQWQLWAVDVATGRDRRLTNVDLPLGTENVVSFSLHPDGTRFLTTAGGLKTDIWMLKGFDRR